MINSTQDGATVETEMQVLVWHDIVKSSMEQGIVGTYVQLMRTAWVYIGSGALFRLMRLRKMFRLQSLRLLRHQNPRQLQKLWRRMLLLRLIQWRSPNRKLRRNLHLQWSLNQHQILRQNPSDADGGHAVNLINQARTFGRA